ncbi:hypothetical protein K461DRAFT_26581 [Myriangium duriaei CBS 260.36]|uniref:Uncharacterized protein n=1 Tax=Myriangium duriaei CBS 260.36 TaxID=1168546 RepID=A0A9P4JAA9_9PEZI|nr:hypothetical protein K461DRAFT_26581 [Myriangium duriaei CBS 260.36]
MNMPSKATKTRQKLGSTLQQRFVDAQQRAGPGQSVSHAPPRSTNAPGRHGAASLCHSSAAPSSTCFAPHQGRFRSQGRRIIRINFHFSTIFSSSLCRSLRVGI